MKDLVTYTHTNTINWMLAAPDDYEALVDLLEATRDFAVDGKQVRVWVTVYGHTGMTRNQCSLPKDIKKTVWNELDFFKERRYGTFHGCSKEVQVGSHGPGGRGHPGRSSEPLAATIVEITLAGPHCSAGWPRIIRTS